MIHAKDKKIIEGELLLKNKQTEMCTLNLYFLIMQFLSATDISGKIHTSICTTDAGVDVQQDPKHECLQKASKCIAKLTLDIL